MCTYRTTTLPVKGSGKGRTRDGSAVSDATVYFDHPVHAPADHTLNVDLLNPAEGAGCTCGCGARPGIGPGSGRGHPRDPRDDPSFLARFRRLGGHSRLRAGRSPEPAVTGPGVTACR